MQNTRRKINLNLNTQMNWRPNKGNVHFLMKRLKNNEQKVKKEKLIYVATAISILIISGIIISF